MLGHQDDRARRGRFAACLGMGGNILLAVLKLVTGTIASSHALIADGLHSLADFFGSTVLLVVMHVAHKPSDMDHPYGHGKAEPVGAKLIGIIVILAGFQVGMVGLERLRAGSYVIPDMLAVWIALVSLVVKGAMSYYKSRLGKAIKSSAVMASAAEHRADAYSSFAVLLGVSLAQLGMPFLDPLAGMVVAFLIIKMGWNITRKAVDDLMDRVTEPHRAQKIADVIAATQGVMGVDDVRLRSMGPEWLVDVKIDVDPHISVRSGHHIAVRVRNELTERIPGIGHVMVHVNPTGWRKEEEV